MGKLSCNAFSFSNSKAIKLPTFLKKHVKKPLEMSIEKPLPNKMPCIKQSLRKKNHNKQCM